jgi:hypothetical protein
VRHGVEGRILGFLQGDSIYLYCNERSCKRFTRIKFSWPGVKIDFNKAAIEQTLMPEKHNFRNKLASVLVGE